MKLFLNKKIETYSNYERKSVCFFIAKNIPHIQENLTNVEKKEEIAILRLH